MIRHDDKSPVFPNARSAGELLSANITIRSSPRDMYAPGWFEIMTDQIDRRISGKYILDFYLCEDDVLRWDVCTNWRISDTLDTILAGV